MADPPGARSDQIPPGVYTIVGALIGAVVVGASWWVNARLQRAKSRRDAAALFRAAFAEAATQLAAARGEDPHALITRSAVAHDRAVFEFRSFLDPKQHASFDAAVTRYRRLREGVEPALLDFVRTGTFGDPNIRTVAVSKLRESIRALLVFADDV
jgi:hypothetical protein